MFYSGDERVIAGNFPVFESLEERQYLTTVVGGETIEYALDDTNRVRIILEGDIIAEIVGMSVSLGDAEAGTPDYGAIGGVSGRFTTGNRTGMLVNGGLGGLDGIDIIGPMIGGDDVDNFFNFDALASDDEAHAGRTYALNIEETGGADGDEPELILYSIDTLTGAATLVVNLTGAAALPTDGDGVLLMEQVLGADFRPDLGDVNSNWLYFVGAGDDMGTVIYRINLDATDVGGDGSTLDDIRNSIQVAGTITVGDSEEVTSIAWDQTSATAADLFACIAGETTTIALIPPSGPASTVADLGEIDDVSGIEFVDDDPTVQEEFVYIMTQNADAELFLAELHPTDPATTVVLSLGLLEERQNPTVTSTGLSTGDTLSGIAWNPLVFNPFTGDYGALIATDIGTDELVILNHLPRMSYESSVSDKALNVFAVYIVHSSEDARIMMGTYADDQNPATPDYVNVYSGGMTTAGDFIFVYGDGSSPTTPTALPGDNTGAFFIGANVGATVITSTQRDGQIGNIPDKYDAVPEADEGTSGYYEVSPTLDENIYSGIVMTETILETLYGGDFLDSQVGENLDRIEAMSITMDGEIYVIDNDFIDSAGTQLYGSEIAHLSNGVADTPMPVLLGGTVPLTIVDMDFGDIDFDGTEELYAIATASYWSAGSGGSLFGTIDPTTGVFTEIDNLSVSAVAMAFSPGEASIAGQQGLYIADSAGDLHEMDLDLVADTVSVVNTVSMTAAVIDAQGNASVNVAGNSTEAVMATSMDFEEDGTLYIYDQAYGRLMDMNLTTGVGGGKTLTIPGSLRPRVGAIAYNKATDEFMAMDNSYSYMVSTNGIDYTNEDATVYNESSVLLKLKGLSNEDAELQRISDILVGGAVTGKVDIAGSVDTFYAGWIITGNSNGVVALDISSNIPNNFTIDGDVRNLVSTYTIGGNHTPLDVTIPLFWTATEIYIGGKLGWLGGLNEESGMLATITVMNDTPVNDLDFLTGGSLASQSELEYLAFLPGVVNPEGYLFENFRLNTAVGSQPLNNFRNDSYLHPQFLGGIDSGVSGQDNVISVYGVLQNNPLLNDAIDYYGVSILAGQTVTVRLENISGLTPNPYHVFVLDPDWVYNYNDDIINGTYSVAGADPVGSGLDAGIVVASDTSDADASSTTAGEYFQFTAEKSGTYVFMISGTDPSDMAYHLEISGIGDLAVGAVTSDFMVPDTLGSGWLYSCGAASLLDVRHGDIGTVMTNGHLYDILAGSGATTFNVSDGNLRCIEVGTFGVDQTYVAGFFPSISVTGGSIGLLRNTWTGGYIAGYFTATGDINHIFAAGDYLADLDLGGGIGNLHAYSMQYLYDEIVINLNIDGTGNDGIIEMFDVVTNMGDSTYGGPQISTGPGGDVRYMHVGGLIFQDSRFTGTWPINVPTVVDSGDSWSYWDDSGAKVTFTFHSRYIHPTYGDYMTTVGVSWVIYAIGGSGGGVLLDLTTDGNVVVDVDSGGNRSAVALGEINMVDFDWTTPANAAAAATWTDAESLAMIGDQGRGIVVDAITGEPVFEADNGVNVYIDINNDGYTPVDVYKITGGMFTSIANDTVGEIVNIYAESIGTLESRGTVGFTRDSDTKQKVYQFEVINYESPYVQLHDGVWISGAGTGPNGQVYQSSVLHMDIQGGLGNAYVANDILLLELNSQGAVDHSDQDILLPETIYGSSPVYRGIVGAVYTGEDIYEAHIGEGIFSYGSGAELVGLFSYGRIEAVYGDGNGADINGAVIGYLGVDLINLQNGSLVNAYVGTLADGPTLGRFNLAFEWAGSVIPLTEQDVGWSAVGDILISGSGGIIGTYMQAAGYGSITVEDGFGIFTSTIDCMMGRDDIGDIIVDGFGIYNTTITAGNDMATIAATGNGQWLDTTDYAYSVRKSEDYEYDPLFGTRIGELNDIHSVLGTAVVDNGAGTSNLSRSGIIANLSLSGQGGIDRLRGCRIITTANTPGLISEMTFINRIGEVIALEDISGLVIVAGSLGTLSTGTDTLALNASVAGNIGRVNVGGDLGAAGDGSEIVAEGPNGYIKNVSVGGSMYATIQAAGHIGNMDIDGDLSGAVIIQSLNPEMLLLKKLHVGGSFRNGALDANGDIGDIIVDGSFGVVGDWLTVEGDLNSLTVGYGDTEGDVMNIDLAVTGDVGSIKVLGATDGTIYVGGSLNYLSVVADSVSSVGGILVASDVTVAGEIKKVVIDGGDLNAELLAGMTLGAVTIIDGDMTVNSAIISSLMDIGLVDVRSGNVSGTISAASGELGRLLIGGSLASGAKVIAERADRIEINSSLLSGSQIAIERELDYLHIGGNLQSDGDTDTMEVSARSGGRIQVDGDLAGDIELTASDDDADIRVEGDFSGTASFWSDASLQLNSDMTGDAEIFVDGTLDSLNVRGDLSGSVIVNNEIDKIFADSMTDAAIISGGDIDMLKINDDVTGSVVQAGYRAGAAGTLGDEDSAEGARSALLNKFMADNVSNSVIASSGDIKKLTFRGELDSSAVASGLSLGSDALLDVLGDATPLADDAELAAALSGTDRQLLAGDIYNVRADGLVNSSVTAGVDAGADGQFDTIDDNVTSSLTGGMSSVRLLAADTDSDSVVLADTATPNVRGTASGTVASVDYAASDLAAVVDGANLVGSAISGSPVVYTVDSISGDEVVITITGPGQVNVYDAVADDGEIDAIVISAATGATKVTISCDSADVVIKQVLTADDVELGSLTIGDSDHAGSITGDGTGEADLWLDGSVKVLSVGSLGGDGFTGAIGGDVASIEIADQQAGVLRVGGEVKKIEITGSDDSALLGNGVTADSDDITAMATFSTGQQWCYDATTGQLYLNGNMAATSVAVTDMFGGAAVVNAMDHVAGNQLLVVATMNNPIPNSLLSVQEGVQVQLTGLTAGPGGDLYAIATNVNGNGLDWLVQIDPATGQMTTVGALRDNYNNNFAGNVLAMTYADGELIAIVNDRDGTGGLYDTTDGLGFMAIDSVADEGFVEVGDPLSYVSSWPVNGGGDTSNIVAMATMPVSGSDDIIYAIRRDATDSYDELVTLDIITGNMLSVGAGRIHFNLTEDTNIKGMDFNAAGSLVAYSDDGNGAELISIDTAAPEDSMLGTLENSLDGGLDGFAFVGDISYGYANYDGATNPDGLTFYESYGTVTTVGTVDTGTGDMTLLAALLGTDGTTLADAVVAVAVDNAATGYIYVATDAGELIAYDPATGDMVASPVELADDSEGLTVSDMDFDDTTGQLVVLDYARGEFFTVNKDTGYAISRSGAGVVNTADISTFSINPTSGVVTAFDAGTQQLVSAAGAAASDMSGILAESIGNVSLGADSGSYNGRLASTAGDIKQISVKGDFGGLIFSDGDITRFSLSDGSFTGSVVASATLGNFTISGRDDHMFSGALVMADEIRSLNIRGQFQGRIWANTAGKLSFGGDAEVIADSPFEAEDYAMAVVFVADEAKFIDFDGTLYGEILVDDAATITLASMASTSRVDADADVQRLMVTGDVADQSLIVSDGYLHSLKINGDFSGIVSVLRGMGSAIITSMTDGLLSVARDTQRVVVGNITDSVLSFGVWIGSDDVYNSEDDVIIGGSVGNVTIQRVMLDSAVVAGVLPTADAGAGIPTDLRLYTGNRTSTNMLLSDSAEAGGIMKSSIGRLNVWQVKNSVPGSGQLNVAAAADEIGRISIRRKGGLITTRTYSDAYGAPQLDSVKYVDSNEIELYFSEEINTASLSISVDNNGDGVLTPSIDVMGSIAVYGVDTVAGITYVLSDITLSYETYVDDDGNTRGIVHLYRSEGYDGLRVDVTVSGSHDYAAVYDRSGMRSAIRDFNQDGYGETANVDGQPEDRAGTIFDGDDNRVEGDATTVIVLSYDNDSGPDDLGYTTIASEDMTVLVDSGTLEIYSDLYSRDYDVYTFDATAWQFLAVEFDTSVYTTMGLFYTDPDTGNREILTAYETSVDHYMAFELPYTCEYSLVIENETRASASYMLSMRLSSTDDGVDGVVDGVLSLPAGEEIAYISNFIGENNNQLGYNDPTQLVYLNFDGGFTTDYADEYGYEFEVMPFDMSIVNPNLAGYEDTIKAETITKALAVYENLPADIAINVELISTLGEWEAATSGLYFTTVDPSLWGLNPEADFTTVFVGEVPQATGEFGMASNIDLCGQDKSDNAYVAVQNFDYWEDSGYMNANDSVANLIDQYSNLLGFTAAHELGHTLGWNHQRVTGKDDINPDPDVIEEETDWYILEPDLTDIGSNAGNMTMGVMSYPDWGVIPFSQAALGTCELSFQEFGREFFMEELYIDTAQLAYWWFA